MSGFDMKRTSWQLIIASFALVFCVANAQAAGVRPKTAGNLFARRAGVPVPLRKKRHFRFVSRSCESGCDEEYAAPGGQRVSLVLACFSGDAESVPRDMQSLMEGGRVLKSGRQRTRRGRRGKRTVVVYPKDDTGARPASIFWYRRGATCFWYIQAGSLKLALEFERSDVAAAALLK
jgi:hypothetical protein